MNLENFNYYNDRRVQVTPGRRVLESVDETHMTGILVCGEETVSVKVAYVVCDLCIGRGKIVNPSIDAGGLSAQDFEDDPSFKSDYFSGVYDITCPTCSGKRVVYGVVWSSVPKKFAKKLRAQEKEDEYFEQQVRAERAAGA